MSDYDIQDGSFPDFLRDPWGILRRRRRWMGLVVVVGLLVTGVSDFVIPSPFIATANLLVTGQKMSEEFVRPIDAGSSFQRLNELVGEVTARDHLLALEKKHDLFPEARAVRTPNELASMVHGSIEIGSAEGLGRRNRREKSNIYAVSFRHTRPDVAATVANELAADFVAVSVRLRGEQARLTTDFLRGHLVEKEAELREQEGKITSFKEQYRGELPGELGGTLNKLERLARERQSLNTAIAEAETRLALMTSADTPESPNSPLARLSSLRSQLAEQRSVYTEEHPNVLSLRRQIATLEQEIAGAGEGAADPTRQILLTSTARGIKDMRKRLTEIAGDIRKMEARVARTPKREEKLGALEGHASVLRGEYLVLLGKVETAELAQTLESAQQGERITVLNRALPPNSPERSRPMHFLVGLAASLGVAAAIGVALELLDPVLLTSQQIEEYFGLPVLGSVPRIN
ncbi:MAG: hypothetical protein GY723_01675 [bacterium]|nr:hypothetical protein [bacterium]MCP5069080.1 hypothetical protein [bacterium]